MPDTPSLSSLPIEVLLDNLLPILPVPDLLRLTCTNNYFSNICSDVTIWKRRLQEDFNFSGEGTARTGGWKFIYRGLANPNVYVWGDHLNGRLGLRRLPRTVVTGVPFPVHLPFPHARIVALIAGGMSFHALDSDGVVHVWGTLDGSQFALPREGFAAAGQEAPTPVRLDMPAPVRSISCGRLHSMCLDRDGKVWNFVNWGRPFCLSSPFLLDPDSTPVQIECGWGFSSFLAKDGAVYVWWPSTGQMRTQIENKNDAFDNEGGKEAMPTSRATIPCVTWTLKMDPTRLPPLPRLPALTGTGVEVKEEVKLKQIAGLDAHIIGLTNHGHVLKFGPLDNETTIGLAGWEYLPNFSDVEKVRNHETFTSGGDVVPPDTMHITHVTANFLTFTAYSTGASSIVLMGNTDTTSSSVPEIIPELQHRSVISVVLGDYHRAALTAYGKLLSWGGYSSGALGLGDPMKIEAGAPGGFSTRAEKDQARRGGVGRFQTTVHTPTEVRFDHNRKTRKDRFCFSATAAGWHTGALVIDLEPDSTCEDGDEELDDFNDELSAGGGSGEGEGWDWERWESPPFIPFHFGFPARGRTFGQGRGG